jgi:hypothetical protein
MPVLAKLKGDELDIFVHMIKNKNRFINNSEQYSKNLIDDACSDFQKTELAKIAEDSNFAAKNRYYLDNKIMFYADKKKMPIDQSKVKDILRNQNIMRKRFKDEVTTYQKYQENTNFEHGILTNINNCAHGDLKALLEDIGVNNATIPYIGIQQLLEVKD